MDKRSLYTKNPVIYYLWDLLWAAMGNLIATESI